MLSTEQDFSAQEYLIWSRDVWNNTTHSMLQIPCLRLLFGCRYHDTRRDFAIIVISFEILTLCYIFTNTQAWFYCILFRNLFQCQHQILMTSKFTQRVLKELFWSQCYFPFVLSRWFFLAYFYNKGSQNELPGCNYLIVTRMNFDFLTSYFSLNYYIIPPRPTIWRRLHE